MDAEVNLFAVTSTIQFVGHDDVKQAIVILNKMFSILGIFHFLANI